MNTPNIRMKTIAYAPVEKHAAPVPAGAAARAQAGGLPPGFVADPANDMSFNGGRIIADLTYTNLFLGAWAPDDRRRVDAALQAVMTDPGLNDILAQYFPGRRVSAAFRPSSALPPPAKATMNKPDVEGLVAAVHAAGKLAGFDLHSTVFNFMLPPGTFLTDLGGAGGAAEGDEPEGSEDDRGSVGSTAPGARAPERPEASSSRNGLGGYHGSVRVADPAGNRVYYAVGVFSEIAGGVRNGIPVFGESWKNVVATFYHELCEARTDPDVEEGNRLRRGDLFGWGGALGEIGDIPIDIAPDIRSVIKEITLADGTVAPLQLMYSNRVHGPEQPASP